LNCCLAGDLAWLGHVSLTVGVRHVGENWVANEGYRCGSAAGHGSLGLVCAEGCSWGPSFGSKEMRLRLCAEWAERRDRKAVAIGRHIARSVKAEHGVKRTLEIFGHMDVPVNNWVMKCRFLLLKVSREQWGRGMGVNFKGYFNFARHEVSLFKDLRHRITASSTSIKTLPGNFVQSKISSSEAGIITCTKEVAQILRARMVDENAVAFCVCMGLQAGGGG
jgi:NAD(P)-dependent dehydrogenase (short-subunit alcohol dehydrogenase family)